MELGETLIALRRETQHSYDEATTAYKRWDEIEKQLKDIDHVRLGQWNRSLSDEYAENVHEFPHNAPQASSVATGRSQ